MYKKIGKIVVFILCITAIVAGIMYFINMKTGETIDDEEEQSPEDFQLDEDLKEPENREYIPLS